MRQRAIGIDFSGAKDAGRRIWTAEGTIGAAGTLDLERCLPAFQRLNCGKQREVALPVLTEWIAEQNDAVIGCDFPFSLPLCALGESDWRGFATGFLKAHPSAPAFRAAMRQSYANAAVKEPKRKTDGPNEAATPWNPWNIRLYWQTHAGIGSVLAPLIGRAAIAPFDQAITGTPLIVETCPASSLKKLGLYRKHSSYKGRKDACRVARSALLDALLQRKLVTAGSTLRTQIVDDSGGDALDAVIAALGAAASLPQTENRVGYDHPIEGWVYYVRG
ncbi:MAG: hypothetical protein WD711_04525 [Dongiaceae bacterium]